MKIEGYQMQKMYEAYAKNSASASSDNKSQTKAAADNTEKTDRVELSTDAVKVSDAQSLTKKVTSPEDQADREKRVAELKNLIQSGQYSVSSKDVARSILTGMFYDRTV